MKGITFFWSVWAFVIFANSSSFAQTVWPLAPQNQTHKIWDTYGQFDGTTIHFHEALDLPAASGTDVLAAAAGQIVQRRITGPSFLHKLSVGIGGGPNFPTAWKYIHMTVAMHPIEPRQWQIGDVVAVGNTLGNIATTPGILAHFHFEYQNDDHPDSWDPNDPPTVADANGNPIELLSPNTDGVSPTVFTPFNYRSQAGEGNAAASYFTNKTASDDTVITGNVDIIARAFDRFGTFAGTNYDLNVRKIEFKADEDDGSANIPFQEAENFSGLFLQAPDGRNSFAKFRDPDRVNVIYEDDNTSNSVFKDNSGATNPAVFYYILTNIDDDFNLELDDADRYWDTDGKEGETWNDNQEGAAHEATSNADAAFPDGKYTITVRVTGQGTSTAAPTNGRNTAAASEITTDTQKVFVNNHDETIESSKNSGDTKDNFLVNDPVFVKGNGFPKNRQFTVYVVKNTTWTDGMDIPSGADRITTTTVTTDANGDIQPTEVWNSYAKNGSPDEGYDMIIDYDGDEKYTTPKEGFTVDAIDDDDILGAGFISGVDVAFIIDDTGSMFEEIDGVKNALLAHLATVDPNSGRVFQLTTFKDNVTERAPTLDLAVIQAQVAALVASGGGDCPEASVEAVNQVRNGIIENGRAFIATDAAPHAGLDLNGAIAALKARGIRVDIVLSGDCPNFLASGTQCSSSNDLSGCQDAKFPVPPIRSRRSEIVVPTGVDPIPLPLGDDDFQEVLMPFAFPFGGEDFSTVFVGSNGFVTFGAGDTDFSESPGELVFGPRRIAGLWDDLNPPAGGTISAGDVGAEFHIIYDNVVEFGSANTVNFTIRLLQDGTFRVEYGAGSILDGLAGFSVGNGVLDPGEIDLSAAPQPIEATANGTAYEIFTANDNDLMNSSLEYAAVTFEPPEPPELFFGNGIEAFSLIASETGGVFSFIPEVNGGDPSDIQRFENSIFNIVQGGITQSIVQTQPPFGPLGGNLTVSMTGANTNFQSNTGLSFDGGGISVLDLNVLSPIQLAATISIDAGASLGFRDVIATTDLGGDVIETAQGVGAFEVQTAPAGPTILGISPPSGVAGQSLSVTVNGINTNFSDVSVLDLGSGIIVTDVTALTLQTLQADIQISEGAEIGFRDIIVTTNGEVATENVTGPFFVSQTSPALPTIVSITPAQAAPGAALTVDVVAENTSFVDGISVLSFSGAGIDVLSTNVTGATNLTASIQIAENALPGFRDVRVTTGTEIAVLLDGFFVSELVVPPDALIWIPDDVFEPDLALKAQQRGLTLSQVQALANAPTSHLDLQAALQANDRTVEVTNDLTSKNLSEFDMVFVVLGIFPNNHVVGSADPEATQLENYLIGGGRLYMEGADMWFLDPDVLGAHDFGPSFSINGITDGADDLKTVLGSCIAPGMDFVYKGQNNFIDRISPAGSEDGTDCTVHSNDSPSYGAGVTFDNTVAGYRTIGNSFEFGGLEDDSVPGATTKAELMAAYLDFFDGGLTTASGQVTAKVSGLTSLVTDCPVSFAVTIDVSETNPAENLGQYAATLSWDPTLLEFAGAAGGDPPFDNPIISVGNAAAGELKVIDFDVTGAGGEVNVLNLDFNVVGDPDLSGVLDVDFSEMIAAGTFNNLLPIAVTEDASFETVEGCILGDVTEDGEATGFDALVIASFAVDLPIPPEFLARIEQGCGDVTLDGVTSGFDALVIATFAVELPIPEEFPVGEPFCR